MDTTTTTTLPPQRGLRRAANVLTSRGRPTPALESAVNDAPSPPRKSFRFLRRSTSYNEASASQDSTSSSLGLGASLKRKAGSLSRSISSKARQIPLGNTRPQRHQRAKSDVLPQRLFVARASASEPQLPSDLATIPQSPDSYDGKRHMADIAIPALLRQGTPMTKVSAKKQKRVEFRLDPEQGRILYDTTKQRFIPIECIKEIRAGSDARYYREQFQLSHEYEDRWLTLIYILEGKYKTLHVIAPTKDVFSAWNTALRQLYDQRQTLMAGTGNMELRQSLWDKQYWKSADIQADQKLEFDEVERMCRRLNLNSGKDDLLRLFKQADEQNRGYLNFADFQRFVKMLKARPEVDRIYKKWVADNGGIFDFPAFERFMHDVQKSTSSKEELEKIFIKYASGPASPPATPALGSVSLPGHAPPTPADALPPPANAPPPPTNAPPPPANAPPPPANAPPPPANVPPPPANVPPPPAAQPSASAPLSVPAPPPLQPPVTLSPSAFGAFLLSPDNAAFAEPATLIQDMTRPLPEYYISSSHNTYLTGHQLVGDSTIEGYIRALLHGCRSVELDIYDGEIEPCVFHGKTLTTKVPVRDVCRAIMKYAFVASPYPIIISAEIHAGLPQQDMLVKIMQEEFGDALVSAPPDGRPAIQVLPSPEDLKGRVLLKAKNLYVSIKDGLQEKEVTVDADSSTDTSSASDSEMRAEIKNEFKGAVTELKDEFSKARNMMSRVRHGKTGSASTRSPMASPPLSPSKKKEKEKVKMSMALVALLVYTVGVKCRGINKKEEYAPEHVFSLSESTANKIMRQGMMDLIKHNRSHVVRIYPKGTRLSSTNYEPHRYWSAGCQLVAINWQTFDLGYMINHAMFQRNGRSGFVLKPRALREPSKDLLSKRTQHFLDVTIISAQQLPRPKDASGREVATKSMIDPLVEVSIHVPDWTHSPFLPEEQSAEYSPPSAPSATQATTARTLSYKTGRVKNNGFNPVWEESFALPFDCVGGMSELVFVRFAVKDDEDGEGKEPLALYCASLGSLNQGYRHLPLHDAQLSQYLFSTLFVHINIRDA